MLSKKLAKTLQLNSKLISIKLRNSWMPKSGKISASERQLLTILLKPYQNLGKHLKILRLPNLTRSSTKKRDLKLMERLNNFCRIAWRRHLESGRPNFKIF